MLHRPAPKRDFTAKILRALNLSLLIFFPLAWTAPLLRAGLLPLFGMTEISVLSGIKSLWETDIVLASIVVFFAVFAPIIKVIAVELTFSGYLPAKLKPAIFVLARLAMADIFLIAIYITLAKGLRIGRLDVAWGLYLFTACVLTALVISLCSRKGSTVADGVE
ncbi:paraquat-inducible protein A [Pacificibacter maritimus]|uniref:Paraquat-inducible protein A n=2 Tax=Pacificibacter maritimus TaxID=762213 RepID=A0A3N4UM94_9RHOB|nr:paraquat-inducible protein A [Pacificibacter maritimus]